MRHFLATLIVVGLGTSLLSAAPATAQPMMESDTASGNGSAAAACGTTWKFRKVDTGFRMFDSSYPRFKDGPGGTVTVSKSEANSEEFSLTATVGGGINFPVGQFNAETSANATKSFTHTFTHSYSRKIPRGKFGNLTYVNYGYRVHWTRILRTLERGASAQSPCTNVIRRRGITKIPHAVTSGWYFWSTRV